MKIARAMKPAMYPTVKSAIVWPHRNHLKQERRDELPSRWEFPSILTCATTSLIDPPPHSHPLGILQRNTSHHELAREDRPVVLDDARSRVSSARIQLPLADPIGRRHHASGQPLEGIDAAA
jgi:hypothetical protein